MASRIAGPFAWLAFAGFMAVVTPAGALAANASMSFSGHVPERTAVGLSPASGETISFTDSAGLRLIVSNTRSETRRMRLSVHEDSGPVSADTYPAEILLGAGQSAEMIVIVPFSGKERRELRICAEEFGAAPARRQNCGSYVIRQAGF